MALTSTPAILLFIGISTVAVSYGCGMRGTTIGGEAGLAFAVFTETFGCKPHSPPWGGGSRGATRVSALL